MERYDKLVRDRIPEIIKEKGEECVIREAGEEEFSRKLLEKLVEEAKEFSDKPSLEEMADIMEVIEEICRLKSWDKDTLNKIQKEKREKRGGFSKRIILEKS